MLTATEDLERVLGYRQKEEENEKEDSFVSFVFYLTPIKRNLPP